MPGFRKTTIVKARVLGIPLVDVEITDESSFGSGPERRGAPKSRARFLDVQANLLGSLMTETIARILPYAPDKVTLESGTVMDLATGIDPESACVELSNLGLQKVGAAMIVYKLLSQTNLEEDKDLSPVFMPNAQIVVEDHWPKEERVGNETS